MAVRLQHRTRLEPDTTDSMLDLLMHLLNCAMCPQFQS